MKFTALIIVLLFCGALAADGGSHRTLGLLNGRAWNNFDDSTRLGYLLGFADSGKIQISGLTINEMQRAVTQFFEDPTNANIPVPGAFAYVKKKVDGASDQELKEFAAGLRKSAKGKEGN